MVLKALKSLLFEEEPPQVPEGEGREDDGRDETVAEGTFASDDTPCGSISLDEILSQAATPLEDRSTGEAQQASPAVTPIVTATAPADAPAPAPSGPRPDVVTFDKVTKIFPTPDGGTFTAIKDVSFTVKDLPDKGEFIAVLGPSGCGKSTVLNIIAGLEPAFPPTTGQVLVRGTPVLAPGPDRGMVFQSYSSFPCYTVLENVALGLRLQGVGKEEREEQAMEWIRRVRLDGSETKYPHQLSGGMRQRVAIARSLALHPRIILMDEPFGALDRITRWEMQDLLVELWHQVEATVFLVTHDIAEAVYLGDRIYLFAANPGRLVDEIPVPPPSGNAAETQRTAAFSEIVNEISRKVERPMRGDRPPTK